MCYRTHPLDQIPSFNTIIRKSQNDSFARYFRTRSTFYLSLKSKGKSSEKSVFVKFLMVNKPQIPKKNLSPQNSKNGWENKVKMWLNAAFSISKTLKRQGSKFTTKSFSNKHLLLFDFVIDVLHNHCNKWIIKITYARKCCAMRSA